MSPSPQCERGPPATWLGLSRLPGASIQALSVVVYYRLWAAHFGKSPAFGPWPWFTRGHYHSQKVKLKFRGSLSCASREGAGAPRSTTPHVLELSPGEVRASRTGWEPCDKMQNCPQCSFLQVPRTLQNALWSEHLRCFGKSKALSICLLWVHLSSFQASTNYKL